MGHWREVLVLTIGPSVRGGLRLYEEQRENSDWAGRTMYLETANTDGSESCTKRLKVGGYTMSQSVL